MGGLKLSFQEWKERFQGNRARGLPEISPLVWTGAKIPPLCIAASGPSLKDHIGSLKRMRRNGARLMAVNRAYGFVTKHGLTPDLFAAFDPDEKMVEAVSPRCEHTTHLLASQIHPKVLDALAGRKVALWHAWTRGFDYWPEHDAKHIMCGGSHIGIHALTIATFLGHFDIHLFGFDGCKRGGKTHAMKQGRDETIDLAIDYEGRKYTLDGPLSLQAQEFEVIARNFGHKFNLTFHGHGLLAAIWQKEAHGGPEKRNDHPQGHPIFQRSVSVEASTVLV